jgi:hypothetical protein
VEPGLHRREGGSAALPPKAARRHLHRRQPVHRVAKRFGVDSRPSRRDLLHELGASARTLLQPPTQSCGQLVHVDAADGLPQRARAVDHPLDPRLDQRAKTDRVPRGDEVQRAAEERHPHRSTLLERIGQRLGAEGLDP